jgi:3-oxoacyl-[acyl-carrier-protein] synthase-1
VLIAAGDVFSSFVFSGFQSFHAVSSNPCKPYSKFRDGITLGEAAAAIFVSNDVEAIGETTFEIVGDSSINDANHISGPSRTGEGLHLSIENALNEAGLEAKDIDCISAHGTATEYNDEMEAQAFFRSHLQQKPVFSLKGFFGHTLGAAGLLETLVTLGFAKNNLIPRSFGYDENGLTILLNVVEETHSLPINCVLKTSSGFGGANTAMVFKKCKTASHED